MVFIRFIKIIFIFISLNFNFYIFNNKIFDIDLYFCTASDEKYFNNILNLIGSIHYTNFDNLKEIAVFNLGLAKVQIKELKKIQKVGVYEIEKVNPDILKQFETRPEGKMVPGWYSWKPVAIKQSLDMFPYVLWVDSGLAILKPLNYIFKYIKENDYILFSLASRNVERQTTKYLRNKFMIDTPGNSWILQKYPIVGFIMGASREGLNILFQEFYEYSKDLKNFEDDGTTPGGFGNGRHDQALLSLLVYLKNLKYFSIDYSNINYINIYNNLLYINIDPPYLHDHTTIYYSARFDKNYKDKYIKYIRYKN